MWIGTGNPPPKVSSVLCRNQTFWKGIDVFKFEVQERSLLHVGYFALVNPLETNRKAM
jgi:hypothetical protein